MWGCDLCLDDGYCHGEKTNTKALNGAAGDERIEVAGEYLDESREEVYESPNTDASFAPNHVAKTSRDECPQSRCELQARDRDTGYRGVDGGRGAISTTVITVEALDKDWVHKQAGHDTCVGVSVLCMPMREVKHEDAVSVLLTRVVSKQSVPKTAEGASRIEQGLALEGVSSADGSRFDLAFQPAHWGSFDALSQNDGIVIGGRLRSHGR